MKTSMLNDGQVQTSNLWGQRLKALEVSEKRGSVQEDGN